MSSTRCKRIGSGLLALALALLLQTPALAAYAGEMDDTVAVRQWAAMLCGAYLDTPSESGCVAGAYRRGWLPVTAVTAPESGLCRGALYQSAFAAAGLHIYDSTLYPGGEALSTYENCLRVGAELGLCPAGTEPMELVTRDEAAALLDALLTRDFQVSEPPMLTEFPIQNPDEVNLNDYLLELRRVPESILRAFADSGWTYAVDFQHLAGLTRRYGTSCTGAADYDKKHIYVSEAKATVHEFGHFLDSMLGFPPGRSSFYEAEAGAASAFLRAYAGTGCREYFADYFAYYIANRGNAEKAAQMERLTPETFAFFSALEAGSSKPDHKTDDGGKPHGKGGTNGEYGAGAAGRAPVFSCRQEQAHTPEGAPAGAGGAVRNLCPGGNSGLPGRPVPAGQTPGPAAGTIQGHTDSEGGSDRWKPLN